MSDASQPEALLAKAEESLRHGRFAEVRRLVEHLEQGHPSLLGLAQLKARLAAAEKRQKLDANLRKAEEMLLGYIRDRKKAAAALALEALSETAPDHPRLPEYRTWVAGLDQELALHQRLGQAYTAGHLAVQGGDLETARQHLDELRKLDGDSDHSARLATEISHAEAGEMESADIEEAKHRFEDHLAARRFDEAQEELEHLSGRDLPKVTLDRLTKRLEESRETYRAEQIMADFEQLFAHYMATRQWQKARELAHQAGERFKTHPRPPEMWNEVTLKEGEERRQHSNRQGVVTLEQLIAQGNRDGARLALKLLQGKIDPTAYAEYEKKVEVL